MLKLTAQKWNDTADTLKRISEQLHEDGLITLAARIAQLAKQVREEAVEMIRLLDRSRHDDA